MTDLAVIFIFFLVGLFAGTGSGLLGIGGGIIYIPALLFMLPYIGIQKPQILLTAISTSLFAALFSSGTAFINHFKLKNINIKKALLFAAGSIITSTVIPGFTVSMNPIYPKLILAFVLIAAFIRIYFANWMYFEKKYKLNNIYLIFFGLFVGALSALSGIGGGLVVVPVLAVFFGLEFKNAIGTSTMVVVITLFSSSLSFWVLSHGTQGNTGFINLQAGFPMIIGAVLGSIYGTRLGQKLSLVIIRRIFSLILIIAVVKIIMDL